MRIRCKPWAKPELEACPFYITDPKAQKGNWNALFPKKQPLRLELGCGKGGFISQEAPANPDYNYIAIDIKNEMLVLAKRKLEEAYAQKDMPLDNVRICIDNIMYLTNCFSEADRIDRIYINFCNPWPKSKHKKRRLTHPRQLVQYRMLLDGEIWFKTDDEEPQMRYFETEHEQMFDEMGKTIKFLIAEPDPSVSMDSLQDLLQYSERTH